MQLKNYYKSYNMSSMITLTNMYSYLIEKYINVYCIS